MTRAQPLFELIGVDGATYLFIAEGDRGWTIRRDGDVIASGSADEDSVSGAVDTFRALPVIAARRVLAAWS